MDSECVFCQMSKDLGEKIHPIFMNKHFFAIFDAYPVSPGHALIISRRHEDSIFGFSREEWIDLQDSMKKVKEVIETKTDFREIYNDQKGINEKSKKFFQKMREKFKDFQDTNIFQKGQNNIPSYNTGNNNGLESGMTIFHFHMHIIPRFKDDVEDPVGGVRNVIPDLGNYRKD